MKIYSLLTFLFMIPSLSYALPIELYGPPFAPPVLVKGLILHQANWKIQALHFHPNGQAASALYTAPNNHGEMQAIKTLSFYPDGTLKSEHDLTVMDPKFILKTVFDKHIVPNGLSVAYHPNGAVAHVANYSQGKLHGPNDRYFPNGRPKSHIQFVNNLPKGTYKELYLNGHQKILAQYKNGLPSGLWKRFHENEILACSANYVKGVLDGKCSTWNSSGCLIKLEHFLHGELHNGINEAAFQQFDSNGLLIESQSYFMGVPHKEHIKKNLKGKLSYQCNYEYGEKHGEERFYFHNGKLQGRSLFIHGKPYGKHFIKFPNGNEAFTGIYHENSASMTEFYQAGPVKAKYSLKNHKIQGKYEEWFPSGKTLLIAHYNNGKLHGSYEKWYENGTSALVEYYRNGEKQGSSLKWNRNGSLAESIPEDKIPEISSPQIIQKKKKLNGKVTTHFSSKPKQANLELNYKNNRLHGPQSAYYPNGSLKLQAKFDRGEKSGQWIWQDQNGQILESSQYKNGFLEGKYLRRPSPTREIRALYSRGLLNGPYEVYRLSETKEGPFLIYHAYYQDNQLEGDLIEYSQNHIVSQTSYHNGKRYGQAKFYAKNGDIYKTIDFNDDFINGLIIEYYPNGQIAQQTQYHKGKKHGTEKEFFPNGKEKMIAHFLNGKQHGLAIQKLQDGTVVYEAEFKTGLRHGMFNKYRPNGSPHVLQNYHEGKLHGLKRSFTKDGKVSTQHYKRGQKIHVK